MKSICNILIIVILIGLCSYQPLKYKGEDILFILEEEHDSILGQIRYLRADSSMFSWRENKIRNAYYYRCDTFQKGENVLCLRNNNQWDTLLCKRKNYIQSQSIHYTKSTSKHKDSIVYVPFEKSIIGQDTIYGFSYKCFRKYENEVVLMGDMRVIDNLDNTQTKKYYLHFEKCPYYNNSYTILYEDKVYFYFSGKIALIKFFSPCRNEVPFTDSLENDKWKCRPGYFEYKRSETKINLSKLLKNNRLPYCEPQYR